MVDSYTKLLLHCDGVDTSQTFTDSATGKTVTAVGTAQVDTAQYKFGGASLLLDGNSDYLYCTDHADFAFGAGDFTIDFWIRPHAVGVNHFLYDARVVNGLHPTIYINTSNKLLYYTNTGERITGTTTIQVDTWYHIALARAGTSTKLFLNGTQEGSTYSDSHTYVNAANRPLIGRDIDGLYFFNGWMDEIRVSKGIARWTANFTPPSRAYGTAGASFLLNFINQ